MGQKVNPILFRITCGTFMPSCRWYAKTKKEYKQNVFEDVVIAKYLERSDISSGIGGFEIERTSAVPKLTLKTNKSSSVLGKKAKSLDKIQQDVFAMIGKKISVSVVDIRKPDLNAKVLSNAIAKQIRRRVSCKRAMKSAVESAMRAGALGVRVVISGRLNGAEIARSESAGEGAMPLHTMRANIDYACLGVTVSYGTIGVKVWVYTKSSSFAGN